MESKKRIIKILITFNLQKEYFNTNKVRLFFSIKWEKINSQNGDVLGLKVSNSMISDHGRFYCQKNKGKVQLLYVFLQIRS